MKKIVRYPRINRYPRIDRHPRRKHYPRQKEPVKRYPRTTTYGLTTAQLLPKLLELEPLLYKKAHRISRPYYCDAEELVQEAMARIYDKRKYYRSDKASIKTWALTVAERQYYKIAEKEYRKRRVPQQHLSQAFVQLDAITNINVTKNNHGYANDVEIDFCYREFIVLIEKRLHRLSKKVFKALLLPPDELLAIIKKNYDKKAIDCENGLLAHKSRKMKITNKSLAEYFVVPKHEITQAKNVIKKTMQNVFNEQ